MISGSVESKSAEAVLRMMRGGVIVDRVARNGLSDSRAETPVHGENATGKREQKRLRNLLSKFPVFSGREMC